MVEYDLYVHGHTLFQFGLGNLYRLDFDHCLFFFSSRRRHTRLTCDWSSDVCSSDLRRARVTKIILPAQNRRDLDEVPKHLFKDIQFVFVDNMRQVFREALKPKEAVPVTSTSRPTQIGRASCRERV